MIRTAVRDDGSSALLRSIVRPYRWRIVAIAGVAFLGGVSEAAFLVVVTQIALAVAEGGESVELAGGAAMSARVAGAIAAVLVVARVATSLVGASLSTSLTASVRSSMQRRLATSYLRARWSIQQAQPSGHLAQFMTSFTLESSNSVNALTLAVTASVSLAALVVGALFVDTAATLMIGILLVVLAAVLAPIRRRIRLRSRAAAAAQLDAAGLVTELGALGLEMQTFGVRDRFIERMDLLVGREVIARRRAQFMRSALPAAYTGLAYLAVVAGLGVAGLAGSARLSSLAAVMLVMLRSLSYGQQLQQAWGTMSASLPYVSRFDETVAQYESAPASGGDMVPTAPPRVEARDVGFSYVEGRPVLERVSFTVEPGEMIGVLGPSGAGKSTLVQLLLGVRDVTSGALLVAGTDLRDIDRSWWTKRVALVAQEPLLFSGTVAENVRFFRDGIADDDVVRAARLAHVASDIEALPDGFDSHLGERGAQLSGGQRQRVSIARALAGRPEILVLDEPTSALDVHSELLVRETLFGLRGTTTVVVIAHRLSTLDICDRLFVVEDGHLVAAGTPSELRTDNAFYRRALELSGMA